MDPLENLDKNTLVVLVKNLITKNQELEHLIFSARPVVQSGGLFRVVDGSSVPPVSLPGNDSYTVSPTPPLDQETTRQNSATSQADSVVSAVSSERRCFYPSPPMQSLGMSDMTRSVSPDAAENYAVSVGLTPSTMGLYRNLRDRYGWSRADAFKLADRMQLVERNSRLISPVEKQDAFMSVLYEMEALSRAARI